ncbi:MAG: LPXTG cell wall anchor domain-containing protein [Clostridiales bacterium]|nr:LPXTG cell wall anchor domain-containing protein [Clostridiales bacterium]
MQNLKFKKVMRKACAAALAASVAACPMASAIPAFAATGTISNEQDIYNEGNSGTDTVYSTGEAANGQFDEQAGVYEDDSNNTATQNDLENGDIIDLSKTGSITIHKYDTTAAEAAGDYAEGDQKATGEQDTDLEETLANYGVAGVGFTILRVGSVETYSVNNNDGSSSVTLVYEIPTELAEILGLDAADAYDMSSDNKSVANPCDDTSVLHYDSTQIQDALTAILDAGNITAKNALEDYLREYNTISNGDMIADGGDASADLSDSDYDDVVGGSTYKDGTTVGSTLIEMDLTDSTGTTAIDGLALGLYLVVETTVPEEITDTVNPFFIELPFTNTSITDDGSETSGEDHDGDGVTDTNAGGEYWLYDAYIYPKNQSGNPTLDKSVRNAYNSSDNYADNNGTVDSGDDYEADSTLVVWNDDSNADGNSADDDDDSYVANRGGYTEGDGTVAGEDGEGYSYDYEYRDTTTASEGDVLDYIIVSRIPTITSTATYITEFTFTDILSAGLTYNEDARVAFYDNAADANSNNTANAVLTWNVSAAETAQSYDPVTVYTGTNAQGVAQYSADGSTQLTFKLTEAGLEVINPDYSGYYMVVYYTATVNSDNTVVLGDEGNTNDVVLTWSRTSSGYYSQLNDRNYVYSYSLDLTKEFSDDNGDATAVQFKLYNATDYYYVVAEMSADGVYYVTGKTTSEADATTFVPAADGSLVINGLEADEYALTEVATDDGYKILGEQVSINITATDRDVIAAVEGVVGLTGDEADANVVNIINNYNGNGSQYAGGDTSDDSNLTNETTDGIYDENGNLINDQSTELEQAATTDANGNSLSTGIESEDIEYSSDTAADGRTINGTDMYVGDILEATATVDGIVTTMANDENHTDSANATVVLTVTNSKSFLLPQTGGYGLYLVTIIGVVVAAGGIYMVTRKKKVQIQ